jgi:hypothetical protein
VIDRQVRFGTDGGADGLQLRLLAINEEDRSLRDVNLAFPPMSFQLLMQGFHSPGTP